MMCADMFTIQHRATPTTASLQEQHLRIFLKTGFARFVELARTNFLLPNNPHTQLAIDLSQTKTVFAAGFLRSLGL